MSSRNPGIRVLGAAVLAAGLASCVSVAWRRVSRFEPAPELAPDELAPGTDLGPCLARLGAPLWAWERERGGFALAWGWYQSSSWNVDVSVPVGDFSASLDYAQADSRMEGLVLFFDAEARLVARRRGLLADLTAGVRRARPGWYDEEEG